MFGKTDNNQKEIAKALRQMGASVQSLSDVGAGCPDLLIGYHGRTYLLEVKNGSLPPSRQRLTPAEEKWKLSWRGQYNIVKTVQEAFEAIGVRTLKGSVYIK